ncbi:MAG TPA: sigma-70 family RNA polymerase sigma factor [Opitutaceae bacterium]|nr:sigma-70 family RNA polymerase sigma factor [Opitutaceae bacterium]
MFATHVCPPANAGLAFAACAAGACADLRPRMSKSAEDRNAVDARLLQRMARGERAAFADLYDRFSRPLYAAALRILGDARETEDIMQDVFIALWEKSGTFSAERGTAFSWAVTLTRHRAIDRLRLRKRRGELLDASVPADLGYDNETGTADALVFKEKAHLVRTALAALPTEQKQAIELAFFSGLTQEQISENLAQPLGTVKARIRRGLLKLRDTLRPHHD